MKTILTKEQAAEIMSRIPAIDVPKHIIEKYINKMCELSNYKFINEFRKVTHLNLCSFGNNKYYIKYELN